MALMGQLCGGQILERRADGFEERNFRLPSAPRRGAGCQGVRIGLDVGGGNRPGFIPTSGDNDSQG